MRAFASKRVYYCRLFKCSVGRVSEGQIGFILILPVSWRKCLENTFAFVPGFCTDVLHKINNSGPSWLDLEPTLPQDITNVGSAVKSAQKHRNCHYLDDTSTTQRFEGRLSIVKKSVHY